MQAWPTPTGTNAHAGPPHQRTGVVARTRIGGPEGAAPPWCAILPAGRSCVDRDIECREIVELITSYLEGALDDARAEAVDQHLRACPGCLAYLEQMRTTIAITGTLDEGDVPDAVMDELLTAFRTFKPQP
jgi:hypothetical protein